MHITCISVFFVLLTTGCHAQDWIIDPLQGDADNYTPTRHHQSPGATPTAYCNSRNITSMDVGTCTCQPERFGCQNFSSCSVCGIPALQSYRNMTSCDRGCEDRDWNCEGCGLWFHSLCDCLQQPTKCNTSSPIQSGTPPIWALLETTGTAHNLITTTEHVPGILELSNAPQRYDAGWVFAQEHYNPQREALALNSFRARTHEQIHIHVCPRNSNLPGILSKETPNFSNRFVPLLNDPQVHCITVLSSTVLRNFATNIVSFLSTTSECPKLVGAGIIQDSQGVYTWGCVTINSAGPLAKLC